MMILKTHTRKIMISRKREIEPGSIFHVEEYFGDNKQIIIIQKKSV